MRKMKNAVISAMASGALAGGLLLAGGSPAAAASCPSGASPVIPGGKASWTLRCSGGQLSVYGWVEDTRRDGKCARVTVRASSTQTRTACGKGQRSHFDWKFPNRTSATVTLSLT
ncbi:hypothetical protein GCM10009716_08000 [Streptomyces sodiiphilus]|uniref:Secreted protein n=1 Tax=Streptomyces sodiiphilus TaxID=226217 RepID=A0ABN2NT37_9ACTN